MEISNFAELELMDDIFSSSGICEDVHNHYSYSQQQVLLDFKRPSESKSNIVNKPIKKLKTNTFNNSCKNESQSNSVPLPPSGFHLFDSICKNQVGLIIAKPEQQETSWSPNSSTLSFSSESILTKNFIPNTTDYQGRDKIGTSTRVAQSQEHLLAERKRREKLSQRFIALSVLVPGLKKTDKASVLEESIEYIKELQEKVKILEKQTKKKTMESVVFVKKYEIQSDGQDSSSDESISTSTEATLPQIEARFCNKDILVHIQCEKTKGIVEKIVAQIEKLHLSVVNSSVMTFGDSALDMTIIAQKDAELEQLDMKEVVKKLCSAFK